MPNVPLDDLVELASECRFQTVFDHLAVGSTITAPDGRFLRVNAALTELLGYDEADLVGRSFQSLTHPDDLAVNSELLRSALAGKIDRYRLEKRFLHAAGHPIWVQLTTSVIRDARGEARYFISQYEDLAERRAAEQRLAESEARFQNIVNNVPGMVYQWMYRPDWTGEYTYVSEGSRTLFDVAPEVALRDANALLGLIPSPDREVLSQRALDSAQRLVPFQWEGRAVLPTGEERVIQIAAHDQRLADGSVLSDGVVMDVTERRELEQQLRQAQKMEAVGQLAGGIAHDFNNLLTVISSYTAMALETLPEGAALASDLAEVRAAAERAADLTRQLLAFGRKQLLQPRRLDTNATVADVAGMLRRVIGEDIVFQLELGHDLWPILADPGQLSQVLMNLAVNARDAMPKGGTLRLATDNTTVVPDVHDESDLAPGDYVMIVVEDSGTGIEPTVLPHVFEPFYTTKAPGHGTGLGLATVYGIVKQSGGYVSVDSMVGEGTRFTVLLPRATEAPVESSERPRQKVRGGSERILLVEDEKAVRRAVSRMLQSFGYDVLEASSVADALDVAAQADASDTRVHLVLTDVVMRDEGGRALGERLAAFWPGIPLVYMSGYTDDEIFRRGLRHVRFLEKPFTAEQLATAIRDALGG